MYEKLRDQAPPTDGPGLESAMWIAKAALTTKSYDLENLADLEKLISSKTLPDYPQGWQEQELYHCEILRRIIRTALMHWNLSAESSQVNSGFIELSELEYFAKIKFPNQSELKVYQARSIGREVIFIGKVDQDQSVDCMGLYISTNSCLPRPVADIHELFSILGINDTSESTSIIINDVCSYYEFQDFAKTHKPKIVNRFFDQFCIEKAGSFKEFIENSEHLPVSLINYFIEGTMIERHNGQHAFRNDLEHQYRATTLEPFRINYLSLPFSSVSYYSRHSATDRLLGDHYQEEKVVHLYIHPTTEQLLESLGIEIPATDYGSCLFYPTVGCRSGSILENNKFVDYQIKFDIFRYLSGWLRLCGKNTMQEETEMSEFFLKHEKIGNPPPSNLILFPTTEAVNYKLGENLYLSTLLREFPREIQSSILIPAAALYSQQPFGARTLLEELLSELSLADQKEFFYQTLITPLMQTWNYFLSLEDPKTAENGFAFEMHGANHYYLYDREQHSLLPIIVAKDFASNRILYDLDHKREASTNWLINEYDHSFGRLHLTPLVQEMSRITGCAEAIFAELICKAFSEFIKPKNKFKFLFNNSIRAAHQDVFDQLNNITASRQKRWTDKPKFRPLKLSGYD